MNIGAAPSLSLDVAARPAESAGMLEAGVALSRREATLRSAATTCLVGIALVQAIQLPFLFAQGRQFGSLAVATMALCMALALALAAGAASASRHLWRLVAGSGALVLAGWAVSHVAKIPGLAGAYGNWTAMPGGISAALAVACLVLATVAVPLTRAALRGLATGVAVVAALGPGIAALLVAIGPTPLGGEQALAAGVHVHAHSLFENTIKFEPIEGSNSGHFVYRVPAPPHQTTIGIALIMAAAFVFAYGAIGYLRRRSALSDTAGSGATPSSPVTLPGDVEGGLA